MLEKNNAFAQLKFERFESKKYNCKTSGAMQIGELFTLRLLVCFVLLLQYIKWLKIEMQNAVIRYGAPVIYSEWKAMINWSNNSNWISKLGTWIEKNTNCVIKTIYHCQI